LAKRILEIDQFLRQFVKAPVLLRLPIDREPGRFDRNIRPVGQAPIAPQDIGRNRKTPARQQRQRLVVQGRGPQRCFQLSMNIGAIGVRLE
jgi:hypothetical protein